MKNKLLKKVGIIVMSATIVATLAVTPFTTMTVYAADIAEGETIETNNDEVNENNGTIETNEGSVGNNTSKGTIETNEGTVNSNNGTIETNEGSVINNYPDGTIKTNEESVQNNYGTIETNEGTVINNYPGGTIKTNEESVQYNHGIIETNANEGTVSQNHGIIETNEGSVDKNFQTIIDNYGTVSSEVCAIVKNNYNAIDIQGTVNGGTVENQWYEVKLEDDESEVKIKSEDANNIKDINNSGNTDVYVHEGGDIILYSTDAGKSIDSVEDKLGGVLSYNKNADGSVTIKNINKIYSLITNLVNKIINKDPEPAPVVEPKVGDDDYSTIEDDAIDTVLDIAEIEEVLQVVAEYEAKQDEIEANMAQALNNIETMSVAQVNALKETGLSIDAGEYSVANAKVSQLILKAIDNGIPMKISFKVNGSLAKITIPAGFNIRAYINADGTIDFAKLLSAIQQMR